MYDSVRSVLETQDFNTQYIFHNYTVCTNQNKMHKVIKDEVGGSKFSFKNGKKNVIVII